MFNTLRYTKVLEEAGVARNQAEAHVGILADVMVSHFVTTQDLKDLRAEVNQEFKDFRAEVAQEFAAVRSEIKIETQSIRHEMREMESRIVVKLSLIMGSMIGTTATMFALFKLI